MNNYKNFKKWFWKCATILGGEENASKYKNYTLPLILLKYISDFYEDEFAELVKNYEDNEIVKSLIEADRELVRFLKTLRWGSGRCSTFFFTIYLNSA